MAWEMGVSKDDLITVAHRAAADEEGGLIDALPIAGVLRWPSVLAHERSDRMF